MNARTLQELDKYYLSYFGYFWCQTIISVGDVSDIENDLEKLAIELKLNYHKLEYPHDILVFEYFMLVINPDNMTEEIKEKLFDEMGIANDSFWEGKIISLFTKKPDFNIPESKCILIPEEKIDYSYLKKLIIKFLINKHGLFWITEPIDEIIL